MTKESKIAIGVLVGLSAVITVGIVINSNIKKSGSSKNKTIAKLFKVPYLEKGYTTISEQMGDEARENELTKEGIEFR